MNSYRITQLTTVLAGAALGIWLVLFGAPSASADGPPTIDQSVSVDGATTSGDLAVSVSHHADAQWTYAVTPPVGYETEWVKGVFEVSEPSEGVMIGGATIERDSSITGDLASVHARFTQR